MRTGNRGGICYVAPDVALPFPSGASVHVAELASNLGRLGHDVHVVVRRRRKDEMALEVADGYTIHRIYRWMLGPGPSTSVGAGHDARDSPIQMLYYAYLRTIYALYISIVTIAIIKRYKLDTIIERETAFGAGGLASEATGRPLLLEIIGPRYSRLSARRSSRILYYTDSMLRDWVDRKKCLMVPGGVNTSLFRPDKEKRDAVRKSLGYHDDDIVVGYVGSFQGWHGVDTLLDAVVQLKGSLPSLKVLLVGPFPRNLKVMSESPGLKEVTRLLGPVPYERAPDYINSCDILVAPYNPARDPLRKRYGIGWPLKILEYLACGKPVVSTRVPPVDRIILDRETGLLVEPGNPVELASAISLLAADPSLSQSVSSKGKSLVDSTYTWSSVAILFSKVEEEARLSW